MTKSTAGAGGWYHLLLHARCAVKAPKSAAAPGCVIASMPITSGAITHSTTGDATEQPARRLKMIVMWFIVQHSDYN